MEEFDQNIYETAVRYLNVRMHTEGELLEKLCRRWDKPAIMPVLKKLTEQDFLNDDRFAATYIENFKNYRDFGHYAIKARLIKKRIAGDIIQKNLELYFTPEDELAVGQKYLQKLTRLRRTSYEQVARSLAGKGYRMDAVRQLLEEKFKKPD